MSSHCFSSSRLELNYAASATCVRNESGRGSGKQLLRVHRMHSICKEPAESLFARPKDKVTCRSLRIMLGLCRITPVTTLSRRMSHRRRSSLLLLHFPFRHPFAESRIIVECKRMSGDDGRLGKRGGRSIQPQP